MLDRLNNKLLKPNANFFYSGVKLLAASAVAYVLSGYGASKAGIIDDTDFPAIFESKSGSPVPNKTTKPPIVKDSKRDLKPEPKKDTEQSQPVSKIQESTVKPVDIQPVSAPIFPKPKPHNLQQPAIPTPTVDIAPKVEKAVFRVPNIESIEKKEQLKVINLKEVWGELESRMRGLSEIAGVESVFGANQVGILSNYNGINTNNWETIKKLDKVSYPLVYPTLRSFFDENLSDFLSKNSKIANKVGSSQTVMIVTKNASKKFVLGYYISGKLYLATEVSLGRDYPTKTRSGKVKAPTPTPEGVFYTGSNLKYHSSSLYDVTRRDKNGREVSTGIPYPMPYSIELNGAIKLHVGKVNGVGRSHGCIRTPLLYIYEISKLGSVKVVVER